MLLAGCSGKAKSSGEQKDPKPEVKEESKRLYTGSGETTIREPSGDRPIRYIIRWKETELDYTLEEGPLGGKLDAVSGELFQDGKPGSTFTANSAVADKSKNLLTLTGKVIAIGRDPKAKLECEKLEWRTDKKLLKATGKVTITFEQGVIGPVDELWCLPDLKMAGTPGSLPE